jgi:hypothetical protein
MNKVKYYDYKYFQYRLKEAKKLKKKPVNQDANFFPTIETKEMQKI